jgi:hypothetical protein
MLVADTRFPLAMIEANAFVVAGVVDLDAFVGLVYVVIGNGTQREQKLRDTFAG